MDDEQTPCEKKRLRAEVLASRNKIPVEERAQRSADACRKLMAVAEKEAARRDLTLGPGSTAAVFYPIGSEVDVRPFVRLAEKRSWQVCYPCMLRTENPEAAGAFTGTENPSASERKPPVRMGEPSRDEGKHPEDTSTPTVNREKPSASMKFFRLPEQAANEDARADENADTVSHASENANSAMRVGESERTDENPSASTRTNENARSGVAKTGEASAQQPRAFLAHPARAIEADDPCLNGCTLVKPEEIDLVVVPLVAFDSELNRLGYGGGNYDRLLAQLKPSCLVMGVAFEEQRIPAVPLEQHDIPLPLIVVA